MAVRKRSKKPVPVQRYAPAERLHAVRRMLESPEGCSVYDVMERLSVSHSTAKRLLAAIERTGDPLVETMDGKRKVLSLAPSGRRVSLRLSVAQVVSLSLARGALGFLAGTGLKEDLDDVLDALDKTLTRRDWGTKGGLARKLFVVGEPAQRHDERIEDVDEIVSALVKEERLDLVHTSVSQGKKPFVVEPYTLLVYRRGLYLVAKRVSDGAVRTYGLDAVRSVERRKGDVFAYPDDYTPEARFGSAFGLFQGDPEHVVVRFREKVKRFVVRRTWHPSQKERPLADGGVELALHVPVTPELVSWLLSFGEQARVVGPEGLVDEVRRAHEEAAKGYEAG